MLSMVEEEKKEESEKPTESKKEEKPDILKEAREIAEMNKKTTEEFKLLVEENKEIAAKNIIAGQTDAGVQPEETKETSGLDYVDEIKKGL